MILLLRIYKPLELMMIAFEGSSSIPTLVRLIHNTILYEIAIVLLSWNVHGLQNYKKNSALQLLRRVKMEKYTKLQGQF